MIVCRCYSLDLYKASDNIHNDSSLSFEILKLENVQATSCSNPTRFPPIITLDQISTTVRGLMSGGRFSVNIRTLPIQQLPNDRNSSTDEANNSSNPTSQNKPNIVKEKFMKQHLMLLVHAKKCMERSEEREIRNEDKIMVC